jgi:thiol-disulfide isomerase/thioredoxin
MIAPSRRLLLATAGAAAAVGVAAHLWRQRSASPARAADDAFWSLAFDTPAQTRLATAALRGRPLVLNFWATWCPPCIREMPALDRFFVDHRGQGWQVMGIACDSAAAVREFLARTPVAFPIALAGFEGVELSRRLGNDSGGLPFTVVFGREGQVRQRHMGETQYEQLAGWAKGLS